MRKHSFFPSEFGDTSTWLGVRVWLYIFLIFLNAYELKSCGCLPYYCDHTFSCWYHLDLLNAIQFFASASRRLNWNSAPYTTASGCIPSPWSLNVCCSGRWAPQRISGSWRLPTRIYLAWGPCETRRAECLWYAWSLCKPRAAAERAVVGVWKNSTLLPSERCLFIRQTLWRIQVLLWPSGLDKHVVCMPTLFSPSLSVTAHPPFFLKTLLEQIYEIHTVEEQAGHTDLPLPYQLLLLLTGPPSPSFGHYRSECVYTGTSSINVSQALLYTLLFYLPVRRTDAFKLQRWRLLRVPWRAKRTKTQS